MDLTEIEAILSETYSPKHYCSEMETYGLQYDEGNKRKRIKRVLLSINLNLATLHYAVMNKINLIISHYGLIDRYINKFSPILTKKLNLLSKYPVSIFVLNTSFIAAEGGVSDTLMQTLYLRLENIFYLNYKSGHKIPIGRICSPFSYPNDQNFITLESLLKRVKNNLKMEFIEYSGNLNKRIKKLCIIGGDFIDKNLLEKAKQMACDCYVSFKTDHNISEFAQDIDLALIKVSHYLTERISMKKLCNILSLEYPECEFTFYETKNPELIYH